MARLGQPLYYCWTFLDGYQDVAGNWLSPRRDDDPRRSSPVALANGNLPVGGDPPQTEMMAQPVAAPTDSSGTREPVDAAAVEKLLGSVLSASAHENRRRRSAGGATRGAAARRPRFHAAIGVPMTDLNRRDLLGLAAASATLAFAGPCWAATAPAAPKRLIVVMLRGAVDGLNTVVPYAEDSYYEARPTIAVPRPGAEDGALALDDHFGLHPALAGAMPLWRDKQLAFVHAAGSPDPTRSHFDAQLFVENGTPGKHGTADGWMNRLLAAASGSATARPRRLRSARPCPRFCAAGSRCRTCRSARPAAKPIAIDKPELAGLFDRLYAGNDRLGRAWREGRAARTELVAGLPQEASRRRRTAPRRPTRFRRRRRSWPTC